MIKRTLTVFFILLANIILLVHAVIPHHHHKSDICIVNNVDNVAHDNCATHNHKHENKGDACDLKQVVVIVSQQIKHEIKFVDTGDNLQQYNGIPAVLLTKGIDNLYCVNTSNTEPPLLASTYSLFAGNSIGLRAPPTI